MRHMVLISVLAVLFAGCGLSGPRPGALSTRAVALTDDDTRVARFSPVFVVEEPEILSNRIGTPAGERLPDGGEHIFVDPSRSTFYVEERPFRTEKGAYTNLVFRVHFKEVPPGLSPFYLTAGENVGLLVIVTLDEAEHPVLYTMVHTCGCYLAFVPTSFLPQTARPQGWNPGPQSVYSETLPSLLDLPETGPFRPVLTLRSGTHRVRNITALDRDGLAGLQPDKAVLLPLRDLGQIRLKGDGTTSFFETRGPRRGYVKSSFKIWERLFISWWALDWRVGEDKMLGRNREEGIVFYTSLAPYNRQASDLREFAAFLKFWGWRL